MLKISSFLFGIIIAISNIILFSANSPSISIYAQNTQYYNNNINENINSSLLNELENIKKYT
jgi:hypothetical protein